MSSAVVLDINDTIATLSFNRPKEMNTYNEAMSLDLIQVIDELKKTSGLRLLVVRGNGPVFMAGGDIQCLAQLTAEDDSKLKLLAERLHEGVAFFRELPFPVLAVVHGAVAGAGLSLMLAADLAIACSSTKFNLAYVQLGASVDGGASYFLPRVIGARRAMELMFLSPKLTAQQALELGLINQVAEEFTVQVECLCSRLSKGPTVAYAQMKRLINSSWDNNLREQLSAETQAFVECAQTNDFRQGTRGFLNKEAVEFTGT